MNTELIQQTQQDKFASWAFLELMGHRKLAGYVQETELFGSKFIRIDITDTHGNKLTQLYRPEAVYCITPTTEQMVRAWQNNIVAAPVHKWELTLTNGAEHEPDNS